MMQSSLGVRLHTLPGEKKFDVFACPSHDKVCECHFAINMLEYGNDLIIAKNGIVCSCASTFNFVSTMLGGATAKRHGLTIQ